MQPDGTTLAQLLSMAALIGATIEYAEVVKRRTVQRVIAAQRAESEDLALRGLVRVFLTDPET